MEAAGDPPPPAESDVPLELQHCPPAALEAYIQRRILQFNAQPALEVLLGPQAAASLQAATAQLLPSAGQGVDFAGRSEGSVQHGQQQQQQQQPEHQLVFRHDCRHLGCADARCQLCANNQARRCPRCFAAKYLCGDSLKAACGAGIRVDLIDRVTGRVVQDHGPIQLQVSIMDSKAFQELACQISTSGAPPDADLDRITLTLNQQGQQLLSAKGAAADSSGRLLLPLSGGSAILPELSVTGSSEALLSGQKPPFALLLRALEGASGERRADIPPTASEGFVVATQRVRTAAKKDIPHLSDHVSKIACVGAATQAKLKDLPKAAAEAGVQGLALPLAAVTTAGEFRQLVEWAVQDATRCDQVRKMLKLQKGWEEARDHALRAVGTDNRLRAFFSDDSRSKGLLFACQGAVPRLDEPLATLQAALDSSRRPTLRATVLAATNQQEQAERDNGGEGGAGGSPTFSAAAGAAQTAKALLRQAKACWARRGHPGWAIVPLDTAAFEESSSHLGQVLLPHEVAAAAVPPVAHTASVVSLPVLAAVDTLQSAAGAIPTAAAAAAAGAAARGSEGILLPAVGFASGSVPDNPALGTPWKASEGLAAAFQSPLACPALPPPSPFQPDAAALPLLLPLGPGPAAAAGKGETGGGGSGSGSGIKAPAPAGAQGSLASKLLRSLAPAAGPAPGGIPVQWAPSGASGALPLHLQLAGSGVSGSRQLPHPAFGSEQRSLQRAVHMPAGSIAGAATVAAAESGAVPPPWPLQAAAEAAAAPAAAAAAEPVVGVPCVLPPAPITLQEVQGGAAAGQQAGLTAAAAAPAPAELGAAPPASRPPIDWAQLLLEAYKPEGAAGPPNSGTDLAVPRHNSNRALGNASALLQALSHASAAAQEMGSHGTLSGMDWEQALAHLDSLPLFPAGLGELTGAGAGGGPGAVTPEWSNLLSLNPAEWAAAMQELQSQQEQEQEQQQQSAEQIAQQIAQQTKEREAQHQTEQQQPGNLMRRPPAPASGARAVGVQAGPGSPRDAVPEQQQQQQQQHEAPPAQPSRKGERKRTLSSLTLMNSGSEEMPDGFGKV